MAAIDAWYEQDMTRIQAEHDAALAKIHAQSNDCIRRLTELAMGSSSLELDKIPCRESKINTTRVGSTTLDQWVYEFDNDRTVLPERSSNRDPVLRGSLMLTHGGFSVYPRRSRSTVLVGRCRIMEVIFSTPALLR
jgi:hypothetical protein